jgi:hypothetical protein
VSTGDAYRGFGDVLERMRRNRDRQGQLARLAGVLRQLSIRKLQPKSA